MTRFYVFILTKKNGAFLVFAFFKKIRNFAIQSVFTQKFTRKKNIQLTYDWAHSYDSPFKTKPIYFNICLIYCVLLQKTN